MKIIYHKPEDATEYDEERFFNSLNKYGEVSREKIREEVNKLSWDPCHVSVLKYCAVQLLTDVGGDVERYYMEHTDHQTIPFERLRRITGLTN